MTDTADTRQNRDLIYDVGLHVGDDTEFYLSKGFRVVAFEADPALAAHCRDRFAQDIRNGRLVLVEGAVANGQAIASGQQTIPFYVTDASLVGSTSSVWGGDKGNSPASTRQLAVVAVDFADALKAHGIPYYLKIDIEGSDLLCLEALKRFPRRPEYVSFEASRESFAAIRSEIELMVSLGYTSFQAIEQSSLPASQVPPNPPREGTYAYRTFGSASSGLFGAELNDSWKSAEKILRQYRLVWLGYRLLGDRGVLYRLPTRLGSAARTMVGWVLGRLTKTTVPGWYDTHARHGRVGARNG